MIFDLGFKESATFVGPLIHQLLLRVFLDVAFANGEDQLDKTEYKAQERRLT